MVTKQKIKIAIEQKTLLNVHPRKIHKNKRNAPDVNVKIVIRDLSETLFEKSLELLLT